MGQHRRIPREGHGNRGPQVDSRSVGSGDRERHEWVVGSLDGPQTIMTHLFSPASEVADTRKAGRSNDGVEFHVPLLFLILSVIPAYHFYYRLAGARTGLLVLESRLSVLGLQPGP